MRKIPTLFKRNPDDLSRVIDEINPAAAWVLDESVPKAATRKYDGTCMMLDEDGQWWARREVKPGKQPPPDYLPVETDPATGKTVGWEPAEQSAFAKFWKEALGNPHERRHLGTYELLGPKINGNPEGLDSHILWWHDDAEVLQDVPLDYNGLAECLKDFPGEGIVWHEHVRGLADVRPLDARMVKIKKRDFGHR